MFQKKPVYANNQQFRCPYCSQSNLTLDDLRGHCNALHSNGRKDVVCPVCSSCPWGDPNLKSIDFIGHLNWRHRFEYNDFVDMNITEEQMLNKAIEESKRYYLSGTAAASNSGSSSLPAFKGQQKNLPGSAARNLPNSVSTSSSSVDERALHWRQAEMKKSIAEYQRVEYYGRIQDLPNNPVKISKEKVEIWMNSKPFARGATRYAYAALLKTQDNKLIRSVIKQPINKDTGSETEKLIKALNLVENQTISCFLAKEFSKLFKTVDNSVSLEFISAHMIKIQGNYYSIEDFVSGDFKKWTNNYGFVNQEIYSRTLNAFSHWTYQVTNEYLMVTDLQGIFKGRDGSYVLTDPAICCRDQSKFSRTNMGSDGINKFFENHQCNSICKKINLLRSVRQLKPDDLSAVSALIASISIRH